MGEEVFDASSVSRSATTSKLGKNRFFPKRLQWNPEEHADFNEAEAYDFGDVHFSGDLPPTPQLMGPFSAVDFGNI